MKKDETPVMVDELKNSLEKSIKALKEKLEDIDTENKPTQAKLCNEGNKQIKKMENNLKQLNYEVDILHSKSPESASLYRAFVTKFQTDINQLKTKIRFVQGADVIQPGALFDEKDDGMFEAEDLGRMNQRDVIKVGDDYMKKTMESAKRTKIRVEETKVVASEVQIELKKHYEKLEYIEEQVFQMDSTLTRVARYIKYFAKQYLTDKLIFVLIFLVLLAILGIIIYSMVDKDGIGKKDDEVQE